MAETDAEKIAREQREKIDREQREQREREQRQREQREREQQEREQRTPPSSNALDRAAVEQLQREQTSNSTGAQDRSPRPDPLHSPLPNVLGHSDPYGYTARTENVAGRVDPHLQPLPSETQLGQRQLPEPKATQLAAPGDPIHRFSGRRNFPK